MLGSIEPNCLLAASTNFFPYQTLSVSLFFFSFTHATHGVFISILKSRGMFLNVIFYKYVIYIYIHCMLFSAIVVSPTINIVFCCTKAARGFRDLPGCSNMFTLLFAERCKPVNHRR